MVSSATGQTLRQDVERAIRLELEQSGAPSIQVAIGHGGEIIFEGAFGLADVENDVPASPETRYRSASISKWLTATAAMRLAEQGHLDLDVSIQRYCPEFPQKDWPITTRQLLTHSSGIRHYADYESELGSADTMEDRAEIERRKTRDQLSTYTRYTDVEAALDSFKDDPLVFEPGKKWLYTSFGYRLLACVLEGASGRTYRALLQEEVLQPAGMSGTTPDDAWTITPHRASGYRLDRGEPLRRADMRDVSENLPAGGHLTTATDLVMFAQAFLAGRLVSAESAALMTQGLSNDSDESVNYTSWRHAIPSRDKYAYGIMSFPNENNLWIGHTGRQAGGSSIVILVPDQEIAIAILTNVKGWGGYLSFARELYSIVARNLQHPDLLLDEAITDDVSIVQSALDFQSARFEAMIDVDMEKLEEFLADDLTYTHTTGWVETKAEFLSTVESGKINYMEVTPREVSVRIYGDIAVMTGLSKMRGAVGDNEVSFTIRFVDVSRRAGDSWQLVAWQSVRLPEDEK
jgi:CubicO group peptidase (beta-lactamase class C family)